MSETQTEETTRESAKDKKARLAAEAEAAKGLAEGTRDSEDSSSEPAPSENTSERAPRAKAPDTSTVTLDAINEATLAAQDLVEASAPVRERTDQQKAMDLVAAKAYAAWVKADKPTIWQKIPVVTYFLAEEDVTKYRYLIRRACAIVEPVNGSSGVRVRFGNEFTLSEEMAKKVGKPEAAGKTVLAWAAVDKRTTEDKPDSGK